LKTIKFSHRYNKMPDAVETSVLLEVLDVSLSDLSQAFLDYDTTTEKGFQYVLPKTGAYLLLLLFDVDTHQLWTTLRRSTPKKSKHYNGSIGETFKIEITEAPKC
jgi:hypothetical protein